MHEIARHWRLREHRLRLSGFKRELEDGTLQFSLTGSNWVEAGRIIYQVPSEENAIPLEIHGEVEISASSE